MPDRNASATAREQIRVADALGLLLCSMQFAVFERDAGGAFSFVSGVPDWFAELTCGVAKGKTIDLVERFPMVDIFLPYAMEYWETSAVGRLRSEFWTESDEQGKEYHLTAHAVNAGERHFLALELADAAYNEQQQVQLYAHHAALQHEEIAGLNEKLERATQAKSEFLASMSHEIRTPMNAILGMADLLSETPLNDEQRKYVEIFQRAGGNLLNLINDILDLSKVEAGQMTLEAIEFELADVVGRATELIRVKAAEKGLEVTSSIAPEVPAWLVGDPTRLRQVLLNLLGNSMKFTERGGLQVRVEMPQQASALAGDPESKPASEGEQVTLRFGVKDTGIGIPADRLDSIFENFTQADSSTTRRYGGSGLGLSISKRLVEMMQGRLWVESEMGVGSTFFFTAQFGVSERKASVRQVQAVANQKDEALAATHILLADDSEDNRFLIQAYLKDSKCVLDFAENGEQALLKAKSRHYDLVLMDVHMPVMDGYAATAKIREWERAKSGSLEIPVLALTADAFKDAIEKSRKAGFTAYLTKPIRKLTLMDAIRKYARRCEETEGLERVMVRVGSSLAPLVPRYLENMRNDLAELGRAEQAQDFATVRRIGHNMKGSGASYGFTQLTEYGAAMEEAAKGEDIETVRRAVRELKHFLEHVKVEEEQE